MASELEFVETSSLMKELQSRMDALVFLGTVQRTDNEDSLIVSFTGSLHACLGLLETGKIMVLSQGADDVGEPPNRH
jgi:hypothetical protein